jgi:hypothetical protein
VSEQMYRDRLVRLAKETADLRAKQAREAAVAAKAREAAGRTARSISKTTSPSMLASKMREIERREKEAADHDGRAAKVGEEIARKLRDETTTRKTLDSAVERRERAEAVESRRRREDELRHLRELERKQRDAEARSRRLREEERAHVSELSAERQRWEEFFSARVPAEVVEGLPERVVILFIAASPRDQEKLWLDEEVRAITKAVRASKYRDRVKIESVWAPRVADLLQALNEHQPGVVHFSGHGSVDDELAFLAEDGSTKLVSKDALAATIATVAERVQLAVLNACYTVNQAQAVADEIGVAIGMADAMPDDSAREFAEQLYSAIGFGYSVQRAFDQAVARL